VLLSCQIEAPVVHQVDGQRAGRLTDRWLPFIEALPPNPLLWNLLQAVLHHGRRILLLYDDYRASFRDRKCPKNLVPDATDTARSVAMSDLYDLGSPAISPWAS
jgi:hypothetical protein